MSEQPIIVAADLGSTTFRVLVARSRPDGRLQVLGTGEAPATGYRDGDFTDVAAGSRALARAVRAAEQAADVDISGFRYTLGGAHLRTIGVRSQCPIPPVREEIVPADVENVLGRARSLAIPFDHVILGVYPVHFTVDGIGGVLDPVGRPGHRLEVDALLVTGSRSVQHNIEHTIDKAGFQPAGWTIDILAAADALLSPAEREAGVALLDVGGLQTGWSVFRQGRLQACGHLPLGGHHLSTDLAHGLRVELQEAERIKCERGVALRSLVAEDVDPEILFEEEDPEETPGLVAAILEPRLEEIYMLVRREVAENIPLVDLVEGVVVTGRGSLCEGSEQLAEEVFGTRARRRMEPLAVANPEALSGPGWATAAGAALSLVADADTPRAAADPGDGAPPRVRGLLRRLFGRGS